MPAPTVGQVVDGFRYLGGDPNQSSSWGPAAMVNSEVDQKAVDEARSQSEKSLGVARQAERFMALNKNVSTGPGMNVGLGAVGKFFGLPNVGDIVKGMNPTYGAMDSITAAVTPSMRPAGSGSTSDYEQRLYRQGFPNTETFGTANQQTASRLHDMAVQDAARSAFLDSWMQHKGTLLGAEPAFQAYWAKRQAPAAQPLAADYSKMSDADLKAHLGIR